MIKNKVKISIVLPCYKSASYIDRLYDELSKTLLSLAMNYEIIFVDDGSPSQDWQKIASLCKKDAHVIGVQLSRNFGQHSAIYAGLQHSTGDWVVVMDSDMQDHPSLISNLFNKANEGYDIVFAKRANQKVSLMKRLSSSLFYAIFNYLTEIKIPPLIGNFGIYKKNVIESILSMKEYKRNFVIMTNWVGFKSATIDTYRPDREESKSTYSFKKLTSFALSSIIYFSNKPLVLIVKIGFMISFTSILFALYFIAKKIIIGTAITGWTSLIVSMFILGGLQISFLGIIGIYLGQIFYQTKKRPTFITKQLINYD